MAELAASNTGRQSKIANRNLLINHGVSKVVSTLGHGTDKDADALFCSNCLDIFADTNQWGIKTEGDFPAVWWQVICDRVLDDAEKLFIGARGADGEAMQ